MKIELYGVDKEVINKIHENMSEKAVCHHEPGHGIIRIDDRFWRDKNVDKAIHYLKSL